MSDQPQKCGKCSAGATYILLSERLGKTSIFSCRRCAWCAYCVSSEPAPAPEIRGRRRGRHRNLSGKTAIEFRQERRRAADALDHEATNAFVSEGPREDAAAAIGMTQPPAHSRRQRHRERYGLGPKPTFPIWLNIPLSKSSAFFKPLSICETLAVGMAIITP